MFISFIQIHQQKIFPSNICLHGATNGCLTDFLFCFCVFVYLRICTSGPCLLRLEQQLFVAALQMSQFSFQFKASCLTNWNTGELLYSIWSLEGTTASHNDLISYCLELPLNEENPSNLAVRFIKKGQSSSDGSIKYYLCVKRAHRGKNPADR